MSTDEILANACAENHDFARVMRRLEGICESHSCVNWPESRGRQGELLGELFASFAENEQLAAYLSGLQYETGGDEHQLLCHPDSPERIYKITHSDSFGCRPQFFPSDPELMGRHFYATVNDNPFFYLRRWMILNSLTNYRTHFEGMLPPQGNLHFPRFCVSQPHLPVRYKNPESSKIRMALEEYGFRKISLDTYLNDGGILLADAAPRNVWIVDEVPVPFDVIADRADTRILEWASNLYD